MNHGHQYGASLVELMIATALAVLLTLIVSGIYFANKLTYHGQSALSRLQENSRLASAFLSRELRMAGYQGCANPSRVALKNWINHPEPAFSNTHAIQGYDGLVSHFNPALSSAITGKPIANSDVISIHTAGHKSMYLTRSMHTSVDPLILSNNLKIRADRATLITNCAVADLFMASLQSNSKVITHTTPNNTASTLSTAYPIGSEVMPYHYYAYYVKNTGRVNSKKQPIYALVREDAYHRIDEIAVGVEQIRVSYAVDTNANASVDLYQTATQVEAEHNWDHVLGLQISLLIATQENATLTPESYYFNGATLTATDNRLRKQWDLFIQLRTPGLASS